MIQTTWERLAAAGGIVFLVLVVVGFAIGGNSPNSYAPAEEFRAWYLDNHTRGLTALYLLGLGTMAFLWFLCSLRAKLREAEGGAGTLTAITFGTGLVFAAIYLAMSAVFGALLFRAASDGDLAVISALVGLHRAFVPLVHFTMGGFMLAASIVMVQTGAIARWLGLVGLPLVLLHMIGAGALFASNGPLAMDGAIESMAIFLSLLWIAVASILMVVRTKRGQSART